METVAIVGVGLMGGSFGLALRKAGFKGSILGVGPSPYIEEALQRGVISEIKELHEAVIGADLIYLADKVEAILKTLEIVGPLARPGTLITDCGSTKSHIVAKATHCVSSAAFVGGHPMAGKEKRGVANADADLFRGRPYVLTGLSGTSPFYSEFLSWLLRIGVRTVHLSPEEHDAAVAFTSHLPQLISTALARTLGQREQPSLQEIFGPGLLDMTRLALSGPDLWTDILVTNHDKITAAIDDFIDTLNEVRGKLSSREIADIFTTAALFARHLRSGR